MDTALRSIRLSSGHTLTIWDANTRASHGQSQLRYAFLSPPHCGTCLGCTSGDGECINPSAVAPVLFCGADYGVAPAHAIDSDAALLGLLGFLCLRPGDTDRDYFAEYTPEQMAWATSSACESLQCDVAMAEEAGGCCCLLWTNLPTDDGDPWRCEDAPTVTDFELVDHGYDGEQYFPGCGTAHSRYQYVVTGSGDTGAEALEEALEQAAGLYPAVNTDQEVKLSKLQESMLRAALDTDAYPSAHGSTVEPAPCDCGHATDDVEHTEDCATRDEHDCEVSGTCNPEWHRYVSIRFNLEKPV